MTPAEATVHQLSHQGVSGKKDAAGDELGMDLENTS